MVDKQFADSLGTQAEFLASHDAFAGLGTDTLAELAAVAQWLKLEGGATLFREGDPADAMFVVRSGNLQVLAHSASGQEVPIATMGSADLVGEISLVFGDRRTATVRSVDATVLLQVPKEAFDRLVRRVPGMLDKLAAVSRSRLRRSQLSSLLPTVFATLDEEARRHLESVVEWVDLGRGEVLFRKGDPSDHVYLIVSGRLRAFLEAESGEPKLLSEMAQGEIVGEMGLFASEPRTASVCAVRKSTLARMGRDDFEKLITRHPEAMLSLMRRLITRLRNATAERSPNPALNIVLVPFGQGMPISDFAQRFTGALAKYGSVLRLDSGKFNSLVGLAGAAEKLVPSDPYSICLQAWLEEQEAKYKYVVFETGTESSSWLTHCVQQADIVLHVADTGSNAGAGKVASGSVPGDRGPMSARKMLVLLHREAEQQPRGTAAWLALTSPDAHCHVRRDRQADFERLARIVSGRAIGLVLGGGGARGFAHIGAIRAFKEAGVPIDMIGGTSMGAIISAQHALGWSYEEMLQRNRRTWLEIKPHREFTLPIIALTRGKKGSQVAEMLYGDYMIEDLWINYFCVSSSLTTAEPVVHARGLLRRAALASASLPGIAVPVIDDGNVLIDGGLLNNLPADVMKQKCGGEIIAVDVGSVVRLRIDGDEFPSPWRIASSGMIPFREPIKTLNIFHVLLGATFLGGCSRVEELKQHADFYLRPPVDRFSLLDLDALEEIAQVGYEYTKEQVENWIQEGRLRPEYPHPDAA